MQEIKANFLFEKRVFQQFLVLLCVCPIIWLSSYTFLTKSLITANFLLFAVIFILNGVNLFSSYFLFFIISSVYLTLRYFVISANENILDPILAYFLVAILIIALFSSIRKKFSFNFLSQIHLKKIRNYKRNLYFFSLLYILTYVFLIGKSLTSFNPLEIITQSVLLRKEISSGFTLYIYQFLQFLSYIVLIHAILIDYCNEDKSKIRLYVIITIVLLSLPLGSRGAVVYNIVYYMLYDYLLFKKLNSLKLSAIAIICIIFIAWYGKARNNETNQDYNQAMQFVFSRFDAIDNYMGIYPYFKNEVNPGASIYNFAIQPIPRSLLPGKPFLFNTFLTERYYTSVFLADVTYDFSAIPEALYNFGMLGIAFLGIYLGFIFKFLSDLFYFAKNKKSVVGAIVYCNFFMYPVFVFIVGWINAGTSVGLINSLISTSVTLLIIKAKK